MRANPGGYSPRMQIPQPRGPLTDELFGTLRAGSDDFYTVIAAGATPRADAAGARLVVHELQ